MKLSELIAHVGDDNCLVQRLDEAVTGAQVRNGGGIMVTFVTDAISINELAFGAEKSKRVGLVVWIPRDKIPVAPGINNQTGKAK